MCNIYNTVTLLTPSFIVPSTWATAHTDAPSKPGTFLISWCRGVLVVCRGHAEGIRLDEELLYVYVINRSGSAELKSLEALCMFAKLEMLIIEDLVCVGVCVAGGGVESGRWTV